MTPLPKRWRRSDAIASRPYAAYVSTEKADPPTSAVGPSFSKGQVNRAGRVLLGLTEAAARRDYTSIARTFATTSSARTDALASG